jgi:probable F420-dependent oxidoreductase
VVVAHPFRFAATAPAIQPVAQWREALQRMEDIGLDTLVLADHFTGGYAVEPMVGLTAAAMCTSRLRLQTGVLCVDYRHPVLVHRMAALLDVLSAGRLVLGLGAGWMASDYQAAGLVLDPAPQRISRLEEAIAVLKGLFREAPFSFEGAHYRIRALDGLPKPVQRPHPPIFVGGGSPRVLRLAGREADIVGINANLRAGELGRHAIVDLAPAQVARKVAWVSEGAAAAGRPLADLELEMNHWLVRVTPSAAAAEELLARIASRYSIDPAQLAESPSVLVGTVSQCIETLLARREKFGISVVQLDAGFPLPSLEPLAPVIAALSGR